jgi:hypothetical protein
MRPRAYTLIRMTEVKHLLARSTALVILWLAVLALLCPIYLASRRIVVNEIRSQAKGVAMATAAGLMPEDLEAIRAPEDMAKDEYRRVQDRITRISRASDDVRYIYTMRLAPGTAPEAGQFVYVVDQAAHDDNNNAIIDPDEVSEPPGKPYDATELPEMMAAWERAGADWEITPDPPYPDLLSGYAPLRNDQGETVAIVGVDITATTISHKLALLRLVMSGTFLMLGGLLTGLLALYARQQRLMEERKRLMDEVQTALNNVKTLRGLMPICASCKKIRNDQGYWEKIETYLADHSDAQLSHGLCPDCARRLYPEVTL